MSPESRLLEEKILRSWRVNAVPWTQAVQNSAIASRKLVTNHAIVSAVSALTPATVLDVGCGEGWLARELQKLGMCVTGIDAVPALVAEASRAGAGEFHVVDYDDIAAGRWPERKFDSAVCNFSLLGRESVAALLAGLPAYLVAGGHLLVQTLHPVAACGPVPYRDGWREGSWNGFGAAFSDPAPWYFRTLASWCSILRRSGFELDDCLEPTLEGAAAPSSIIFVCRVVPRKTVE